MKANKLLHELPPITGVLEDSTFRYHNANILKPDSLGVAEHAEAEQLRMLNLLPLPEYPVQEADNAQSQPPLNVWLVGQDVSPTQRRGRYVPQAYVHPAKMLPELARKIIATYSERGGLVVDPMAGIGTSGVEAAWLGRRYVGIETESSYADLHQVNLDLAITQGAPCGEARVIVGDARTDHAIREADLVTFSPPYQDAIHNQGNELARIQKKIQDGSASPELRRRFGNWQSSKEPARAGTRPDGYSSSSENIGHFQGPKYWDAMISIYQNAFDYLRPGGYLVVVTKDQRDRKTGELMNTYGDTVARCRQIGFALHQHVVAVLCRIDPDSGSLTPRTSQWQRMAVEKAKTQNSIVLLGQFEDVAVFRKPSVR